MTSNTVQKLLIQVARSLGQPTPSRHVVERWALALADVDDGALDFLQGLIAKRHLGNALPKPAKVLAWFNEEGSPGRTRTAPEGCDLCREGTVGQLPVLLAWSNTRPWPWTEALQALRAGERPAGWSVRSFQIVCDCVSKGHPFRVLSTWMQADQQEVLDGLIEHSRSPKLWKAARRDTEALARRLNAGRQVAVYGVAG